MGSIAGRSFCNRNRKIRLYHRQLVQRVISFQLCEIGILLNAFDSTFRTQNASFVVDIAKNAGAKQLLFVSSGGMYKGGKDNDLFEILNAQLLGKILQIYLAYFLNLSQASSQ